jgi:predicted homoserine dehydrogenase-like protein
VYGQVVPAAKSQAGGLLPIGLAHGVRLLRDVPAGQAVTEADVSLDRESLAVRTRAEMRAAFAPRT